MLVHLMSPKRFEIAKFIFSLYLIILTIFIIKRNLQHSAINIQKNPYILVA